MEEKIGRKIGWYEKLQFIGADLDQWELIGGMWENTTPIYPDNYLRIKCERENGFRLYEVSKGSPDRLLNPTFFVLRADCRQWAKRVSTDKLPFIDC